MNSSTVNSTAPAIPTNSTSIQFMEYLEICVYSINLVFCLPTNSYVIWLIVTRTASGVASEFFILNLSVCELGISLNGIVFILSMWFASFAKFELFLAGFSLAGRPLFQCLVCVERYLAVVHPVTFLKYKPLRYRVICCSAVWIVIFVFCFWCMFVLVSKNRNIHMWLSTLQMILFLSIQLFCLVAVLRALKQSGPGERKREKEEENHMKRRAFYLILITSMTTVIMYVPHTLTGFFEILTRVNSPTTWFTALSCFTLSGFVQPALYLHRTGKLRCLCSL